MKRANAQFKSGGERTKNRSSLLPCLLKSTNAPGSDEREIAHEAIKGYNFHEHDARDNCAVSSESETARDDGPGEGACNSGCGRND